MVTVVLLVLLSCSFLQIEQHHFKTRIGLICSCLGCVVGTGNIWRFPRIVANNSDEEGK
jgi:SNF family Na+-dependent transporter